jgi:hypothetical protein
VPAYVNAFDVALIPYRLAEYTANVYPTKLNEYLVMGKPVVATDLPEIRRFNDTHGAVVRIASSAEAFSAEVRAALGDRTPQAVERRIAVAQENSWRSARSHARADRRRPRRACREGAALGRATAPCVSPHAQLVGPHHHRGGDALSAGLPNEFPVVGCGAVA